MGMKFGRLTVIDIAPKRGKKDRRYWTCKCECGNIIDVSSKSLNNGDNVSCGCYRKDFMRDKFSSNLKGKTFNRWSVLKQVEKSKHNKTNWLCKCSCGNSRILEAGALISGNSKSCGCLKSELARSSNNPKWVGGPEYSGYENTRDKIGFVEDVRRDPQNTRAVQVKCKKCDGWFSPTASQVRMRIEGVYTYPEKVRSEGNFYCSDKCKNSCSIFGKQKYREGENTTYQPYPSIRMARFSSNL